MIIKSAQFVASYTDVKNCPPLNKHEFAFIGRSNVGKSSLINMLTNRNKLAFISSTPGKTQLINYFLINKKWYLVDLPGYGYAKTSKKRISEISEMVTNFILKRTNIICFFVLIDIRHSPQKNDLEFMKWLALKHIPFVMVFTKTDKISKTRLNILIEKYKNVMLENWEEMPHIFLTSSKLKHGKIEILSYIENLIQ